MKRGVNIKDKKIVCVREKLVVSQIGCEPGAKREYRSVNREL